MSKRINNPQHLPTIAQKDHKIAGLYRAWRDMKTRCYNSKRRQFYLWGGRGILVCTEWLDFKTFMRDMLSTYKLGLTLDRINTNGNYEFNNCRWVDSKIQNNNRRDNVYITFKRNKKTLAQWAKFLDIKPSTLYMRYFQYHWSPEKCLSTPVRGGSNFE